MHTCCGSHTQVLGYNFTVVHGTSLVKATNIVTTMACMLVGGHTCCGSHTQVLSYNFTVVHGTSLVKATNIVTTMACMLVGGHTCCGSHTQVLGYNFTVCLYGDILVVAHTLRSWATISLRYMGHPWLRPLT